MIHVLTKYISELIYNIAPKSLSAVKLSCLVMHWPGVGLAIDTRKVTDLTSRGSTFIQRL